jgi:hypothetical protein
MNSLQIIQRICNHFKRKRAILQKIGLSELIPEDTWIQMHQSGSADGNISMPELMSINRIIGFHKPLNLFEIGTFNGRTTLNMAANCSKKSKVYTLDLPKEKLNSTDLPIDPGEKSFIDKEVIGSNYLRTNYAKKIIQLYGDSATFDFSRFNNKMDFVFIDGSHSYEYVLNDSKKALSLLKKGKGVIVWHDYGGWIGVTKALNELYLKNERFKDLKHIQWTSLAYLFINSKLK